MVLISLFARLYYYTTKDEAQDMPPSLPSGASASRLIPSVTRAFASASLPSDPPPAAPSSPTPNKDHHIHTYGPEAFPLGFQVSSTHCGVKKKSGVLDLGILVSTSDRPCSAAACVTRNVFKAAPVTVTNELLKTGEGRARGFIVNSGCANAVTGKKGLEDAWSMSKGVTGQIPPPPGDGAGTGTGTLVMSTGVIGQHLPIDKITGSIPDLVRNLSESPKSWLDLARSFMTTDTFPKLRTRTFTLGGRMVRMAGIDKGAGMIAPNMGPPHATLLGVIATDAAISPPALQSALNYAVDRSFNSITVDGDMSTNDTILCLANGAAGTVDDGGRESSTKMEEITEEGHPKEFQQFKEELREFAEDLAKLVVRDGEGATKFVTVRVKASQLTRIPPSSPVSTRTLVARTDRVGRTKL